MSVPHSPLWFDVSVLALGALLCLRAGYMIWKKGRSWRAMATLLMGAINVFLGLMGILGI